MDSYLIEIRLVYIAYFYRASALFLITSTFFSNSFSFISYFENTFDYGFSKIWLSDIFSSCLLSLENKFFKAMIPFTGFLLKSSIILGRCLLSLTSFRQTGYFFKKCFKNKLLAVIYLKEIIITNKTLILL